ncbi:hypothetical protein MC885_002287 [Smutsia gigantea]|nr:hypothetical protein MC885_002287 [Smutsia gigantea]
MEYEIQKPPCVTQHVPLLSRLWDRLQHTDRESRSGSLFPNPLRDLEDSRRERTRGSRTSALQLPEGTGARIRFRSCVPVPGSVSRGAGMLRAGFGAAATRRDRQPAAGRTLPAPSPVPLRVGPTMRRLGSVQRKMPCVFATEVKEEPATKREHQPLSQCQDKLEAAFKSKKHLRCYGGDDLEKEEKVGDSEEQLDHPEIPWACKL